MTDDRETDVLVHTVVRIHAGVLALVGALISGFGLFAMTAWLLIKGGPTVGTHLGLLGNYFYGYSVTWGGSLVGFAYGALVGGAVGWVVGTIYNRVVSLRHADDQI